MELGKVPGAQSYKVMKGEFEQRQYMAFCCVKIKKGGEAMQEKRYFQQQSPKEIRNGEKLA